MRASVEQRTEPGRSAAAAAATILLLALLGLPLATTALAAPGETWTGTFSVNQEISYSTTDANGGVTGSYSKTHLTSFTFEHVSGFDDDPYVQPVASWSTTYAERQNSGGRCPSYTAIDGEASGSDGRLEIRIEPEGQVVMEVLDYGSPGTFPATQSSQSCQDNGPSVSSTTASHQRIFIRTTGDPTGEEFAGSVAQPNGNGTTTYEWHLTRGGNPSEGDDDLTGTAGPDVVELFGGNDVYSGLGGDDKVYGGQGDDQVDGDTGNDLLIGGSGGDTVSGGGGADRINGDGPDSATRSQSYRDEYAATAAGPDLLFGGGGGDRLTGGGGVDRFNGGPGRDTCIVDSRREKRRARSCETIRLRRSH